MADEKKLSFNPFCRAGFFWAFLMLVVMVLPENAFSAEPFAVPTFHALGVYWSPAGGSADRFASVSYRRQGAKDWLKALSMRYNPIAETDEDRADYRGCIVNLMPNTRYEIKLTLEGTSVTAQLSASTWNENFPIGETQKVSSQNTPFKVTESGTPNSYRLYDGTGATIDVKHGADNCIIVKASYVILRGFTLKAAGLPSPGSGGYAGAIQIEGGHDIIIERCDISDWGRPARKPLMANQGRDMDSGINCNNPSVSRIVIQRCRIHHPHYDTNHWYEPVKDTHPEGPQCICFIESAGNHVIRYNECYSDADHMYNDVLGGGKNASYRGFPGPDSDVYCNALSHCWDDALEIEGSDCNVRVWNNYISNAAMGLGNAPVCIGPLYFWRNVMNRAQWNPEGKAGQFIKMGYATGEEWMRGWMFLFHNTIFQEDLKGCGNGIGGDSRIMKHTVTRNNVLQLRRANSSSISHNLKTPDNDFDYDLFNGAVPKGHEAHGINGEPRYVAGAGFNVKNMKGNFQLAAGSPVLDAGAIIPNFSDGWTGAAPDMGAHESGWPAMQFGVEANFQPEGGQGR